ncbi:MAG: RNA chaperone Hfq [Candidatus Methanoperedens sp.]|nr:RNA chaperone Hfq [Candidatus Methanoperedens sp.]
MIGEQKIKDEGPQKSDKYLSDFMNKVVVCYTLSGKTITGILTGYDKYELILVETKDIKSKNPKKIVIYKHGLVSIQEMA